jgi:glycopeptide antibiotics resistance protein
VNVLFPFSTIGKLLRSFKKIKQNILLREFKVIPIKIQPELIQRLSRDTDQNPARLSYSLLVYMIVIVFLITLIPFQFSIPENFAFSTSGNLNDIITNILFFLPIGFLLRLSQKPGSDRVCLLALVLGITVSLSVETCQLFIPGRSSTIVDVVTNGLGAWIGAVIAVLVRKKMDPVDTHGMFAPELPRFHHR